MQDPLEFGRSLIAARPRLRRYAESLTSSPDEVRVLVQMMLQRGWHDRGSFPEGGDLEAWLKQKTLM